MPAMPAELPGAETRVLRSLANGQDYQITVACLADLDPTKRYPALYMLDANASFAWVAQQARLLQLGQELPEIMIVGIGFDSVGSTLTDASAVARMMGFRRRDYWPVFDDGSAGGGAESFLKFVEDEVKPLVGQHYPVDPNDSAILGDSAGAVFALYALLSGRSTFRRYVAVSPTIGYCTTAIHALEENLALKTRDVEATVFMAAGSAEPDPMVPLMQDMAARLRGRNYANLELVSEVFDGETHVSVVGTAFAHGLKAIYAKDRP